MHAKHIQMSSRSFFCKGIYTACLTQIVHKSIGHAVLYYFRLFCSFSLFHWLGLIPRERRSPFMSLLLHQCMPGSPGSQACKCPGFPYSQRCAHRVGITLVNTAHKGQREGE